MDKGRLYLLTVASGLHRMLAQCWLNVGTWLKQKTNQEDKNSKWVWHGTRKLCLTVQDLLASQVLEFSLGGGDGDQEDIFNLSNPKAKIKNRY